MIRTFLEYPWLIALAFFGVYLVFALALGSDNAARLFGRWISALVVLSGRCIGALFVAVFGAASRTARTGNPRRGRDTVLGPEHARRPIAIHGDCQDYRGTAIEGDLRCLHQGGLPFGRFASPAGRPGRSLTLPPDLLQRGCLVVGPTGSGKSESVLWPWMTALLQSGASVVTVDVKGDVYDRLAPAARAAGARTWYWSSTDQRSQSWNWMADLRDDRDVEAVVRAILGERRPNDPQPFFHDRDCRWLRALVCIMCDTRGERATPRELYGLVSNRDVLEKHLRDFPASHRHQGELTDLMRLGWEEWSRAISGLLTALHLFNTDAVAEISTCHDFQLEDLDGSPTLLIAGASLADGNRSEVLSSVLLSMAFNTMYRRLAAGAPRRAPVYFVIDEAARLKDRIPYEQVLSVVRSAGVGVCLAAQDVAQFGNEQERSPILANCNTFVAMRGCSPATAGSLTDRLGERMTQDMSQGEGRGYWDVLPRDRNRTIGNSTAPVLRPREIMHPPETCGRYCAVAHVQPVSPRPFLVDFSRS